MACQTKIAKVIVNKSGDYLFAVKNNQGKLRKAVETVFAKERANIPDVITLEEVHGRIESRQCYLFGSDNLEGDFTR